MADAIQEDEGACDSRANEIARGSIIRCLEERDIIATTVYEFFVFGIN